VTFDDEPPHRAGVVVRPHRVDESDVARAFRFLEQHDVMGMNEERRECESVLVGAIEEKVRDALAPCNGSQL
jgi:Mrp family chromosome partitioning ATPase